jgi:Fic family protein
VPNWDEDSPQLRHNLAQVLKGILSAAEKREKPTLETARAWHTVLMRGLHVPNPRAIGAFRGEPGLENIQAKVGSNYGVNSVGVAAELRRFEAKLQELVAELDARAPFGRELDADHLAAIVDLCAWAHAVWVRIHPFANGNGRIARLWANYLAVRYGLPPFVRLRPRPNAGYEKAAAQAMQRNWKPTAIVFRRLLDDFLSGA